MRRVSRQQRLADIIDDHLLDFLRSLVLMQQILPKGRRRRFRHMFMLGDGCHFGTGQAAKRDAIFH